MATLRLENFLPYRLNRAAAAASMQLSSVYRRSFGLTIPEWRTLATLGQFEERTAKQIGGHSAMHKTKVSRAVAALERRRWLTGRTDPKDRRLEHLSLTATGRSQYRSLAPQMLAFEDELMARLSADDRAALIKGLAALEAALEIGSR